LIAGPENESVRGKMRRVLGGEGAMRTKILVSEEDKDKKGWFSKDLKLSSEKEGHKGEQTLMKKGSMPPSILNREIFYIWDPKEEGQMGGER